MENENCLEGVACPSCGHTESFKVEARLLILVYDDGVTEDKDFGHYDWDEESYIECYNCAKSGKVKDFRKEPSA